MEELERRFLAARESLLTGDAAAFAKSRQQLLGAATMALVNQDNEPLRYLARRLGIIASLMDRFRVEAAPGDSFRLLADVMADCAATSKPMERIRLANPRFRGGRMLREIQDQPGITPSQLAARMGMEANDVSNVKRKLMEGLLIHETASGRQKLLFLTDAGREALQFFEEAAPVQNMASKAHTATRSTPRKSSPWRTPSPADRRYPGGTSLKGESGEECFMAILSGS